MTFLSRSLSDLNKTFSRFFIINSLAVIGILCGIIPEIAWNPSGLIFSFSAYTQEFSQTQINQYAKAVLAIEVERKSAYQRIQKLLGTTPPPISCNKRDSLKKLPNDAQKIAVDFCNKSIKITKDSGLKSSEFNAITDETKTNLDLRKRIQNAIIQIRQQQKR
ncbi:MAG: DUF4168 domain-containing protein [Snowella sp.]|nr:DUF4168 domain-containing protein [Snowella sp.]